jgi:hypothetical protein
VIGTSSDEDAPRPPESAQLARENHQLRTYVSNLQEQSKLLQRNNVTLRSQLENFRSAFATRMKTAFKK